MIKLITITLLTLWTSSVAAQAQKVPLRSGEHDDFTRLVATLTDGAKWNVEQSQDKVEIRLTGRGTYDFDMTGVFEKIPRTRISDVNQTDPGTLKISLACNCKARWFFLKPNILVIDVLNEVPDQAPVAKPASPMPVKNAAAATMAKQLLTGRQDRNLYSTGSVTDIAEALADQATRQILDVSDLASLPNLRTSESGREIPNIDVPNLSIPAVSGDGKIAQRKMHHQERKCTALSSSPTGEFATNVEFNRERSRLLATLYTERLELDKDAAVELAQLYVAFGLGAEARQVLHQLQSNAPDIEYLTEIANIVEQEQAKNPALAAEFLNCGPDNVMWHALVRGGTGMTEDEAWAIAKTAGTLTGDLLKIVAPDLIEILVNGGFLEAADMIAKIRGRTVIKPGSSLSDVLLVENPAEQEKILQDIANSSGVEAAEATARLVEQRMKGGLEVSSDLANLVASHSKEKRHTESADLLRHAEIYAMISRGEFDAALKSMSEATFDTEMRISISAHFFRFLTESADTVTFLRIAIANSDLAKATVPADLRQSMAKRLYDTGFASSGDALLSSKSSEGRSAAATSESAPPTDVGAGGTKSPPIETTNTEFLKAQYKALMSSGNFDEASAIGRKIGLKNPVAPLQSLDRLEFGPGPRPSRSASTEITLRQAEALTSSSKTLAETIDLVLMDPAVKMPN